MGEEEANAAEKSDKGEIVVSVAAKNGPNVEEKIVGDTISTGILDRKHVGTIANEDSKPGGECVDNARQPQAGTGEAVAQVQDADKSGKELDHKNQDLEQKAEIQEVKYEPVAMVVDQKASDGSNIAGEVEGGCPATAKHIDLDTVGNPAERSNEATGESVPEERKVVDEAVLGFASAQVTPSSIPFLSSSTSPVPATAWKPELGSHLVSKEVDDAPKLGTEADSSAYDDLPPLDRLQKDTLSLGGDCLGDSVPNSGPTDLIDDSGAADLRVSAASEELVLGTENELLQSSSTPLGTKSVKTARLQFYSPRRSIAASHKEKAHVAELSLRHVLSDPISGSLMDDAMVAQCGHSFGHASLQRVIETNICTSCGATVPPGSLVPNLALRAAVLAFRREDQLSHPNTPKGSKRRREQLELSDGTDAKRLNRAQELPFTPMESFSLDGSRPRGVQFPFVVSDRVLIKGNKRTPERFVGREAIITTQCLNGWYMVRTLDNGESVRLQYRSLQKLGDTHVSPDSEGGTSSPPGKFSTSPVAYLKESPERSPFSMHRETRAGSSAPPVPPKGLRTEYQKKMSRGGRKTVSRPSDLSAPTSSPSGISSNSSREISADQVTGSKSLGEHSKLLADLTDEGRDVIGDQKPTQAGKLYGNAGADNGVELECHAASQPRLVAERNSHSKSAEGDVGSIEAKKTRRVANADLGGELSDGIREHDLGGDSFTTRSKRSVLHSRGPNFNAAALLADPDPYRKVYTSGSRRRAFMGEASNSLVSEQTPALLPDNKPPMKVSDGDQVVQQIQELEVKTNGHADTGEEKGLQDIVNDRGSGDIIQMMRKDVLKLERMTPWSCLQKSWKLIRNEWRKGVKESCTVVDLGNRVEEFRRSLLLTSAGGMSDEDWELRIAATKQAGDVELLIPLWGRLYEDVYKWLESKPKAVGSSAIDSFHVDPEFQKHFPQLCANGMSPVAFTAAATLATADVVLSDGPKDAEAMVAVMVKQLRQHNRHDLIAIREGLEREKRHIAAKLAQLDCTQMNGSSVVAKQESLEDATLISNLEAFVRLPTPDCIPLVTPVGSTEMESTLALTSPMEEDILKSPLERGMEPAGMIKASDDDTDGGESDAMIHLRDNDGEATDMSDSD